MKLGDTVSLRIEIWSWSIYLISSSYPLTHTLAIQKTYNLHNIPSWPCFWTHTHAALPRPQFPVGLPKEGGKIAQGKKVGFGLSVCFKDIES